MNNRQTNIDINEAIDRITIFMRDVPRVKSTLLAYHDAHPRTAMSKSQRNSVGYVQGRRSVDAAVRRLTQFLDGSLTDRQRRKAMEAIAIVRRYLEKEEMRILDRFFQYRAPPPPRQRPSPPPPPRQRPSPPPPPPPPVRQPARQTRYFAPTLRGLELRRQYRKLALQMHPNKGGNANAFKAMQNEYNRISNERKR